MSRNVIHILDVTNRDGVQTARIGLAKLQKTLINLYLDEMGIFQSEMGFPTTLHENNYIRANLELARIGAFKKIRLSGWTRALASDVAGAIQRTGIEHLNISISTSEQMIQGKFMGKMSHEDVILTMVAALRTAKDLGCKTVGVNAEDASRTDMSYLIEFSVAARENGAERIRYCDTLGYDDPFTIYDRIHRLATEVKLPVELHCHNDIGMVVACTLAGAKAAIDAGMDAYMNSTINGIGERAGNADLVALLLALRHASGLKDRYLLDSAIDLKMSWRTAKYAAYAFGIPIPLNQPGVGANAFAHESGIHADGALKDRRNYELYDPEELGRGEPEIIETGRQITVGEYGGIKGFRNVYDRLEVQFDSQEEANDILELVRFANVSTQKPLTADELRFIARYPDQARLLLTMTPPGVQI